MLVALTEIRGIGEAGFRVEVREMTSSVLEHSTVLICVSHVHVLYL